ncbi:MAG: type II toxin-antitoxin system HicB family antitoxin [Anaerolineae bacterium]|nr:type II toxin-antitoxin system HicB family antitoxin [Anaerolineae bacterium]
MHQIIIQPDETGGYVAECPSLPSCISQGETIEEAIEDIREAIALYIEVLQEDGQPVPDNHLDRILIAV